MAEAKPKNMQDMDDSLEAFVTKAKKCQRARRVRNRSRVKASARRFY